MIACRLFGAKPLSEPVNAYFNWTYNTAIQQFQYKLNAFEDFFLKMAALCLGLKVSS